MSTVATNLVATMMQNNFSRNTTTIPNQSTGKAFQDYFTQSKDSVRSNNADTSSVTSSKNPMTQKSQNDNVKGTVTKPQEDRIGHKDSTTKRVDSSRDDKVQGNNEKEVKHVEHSEETVVTKPEDVAEDVLQEYAQALGIPAEQLAQLLQSLNLQVQDLLNPEVAQEIVMVINQLDNPVDLITNEQAMDQLRAMNQVTKEMPQEIVELLHSAEAGSTSKPVESENVQVDTAQQTDSSTLISREAMENQKQSGDDHMMQQDQTSDKADGVKSNSSNGQDTSNNRINFENALNHVVTQKTETIVMNNTVQTIVTNVSAKDVFDQIVDGMKVAVTDNKTTMTLQLQPENLGKIALNLTSENGVLTGHFIAESEAVKEAIEANLAQLKTQLQQQGLNVNEIKITVGDSQAFFAGKEQQESEQQSAFKKQTKSSFRVSHIQGITEEENEDEPLSEILEESSSVEFSA